MKLNLLKNSSLRVASNLARVPSERTHAIRQYNCGTYLSYAVTPVTLEMFLKRANWCGLRSCPLCNRVRAIKRRIKVFAGLTSLANQHPNLKFALLTLTVKNCHQSLLRLTMREMEGGWFRLRRFTHFPAIGFLKSWEVTRPCDYFYAGFHLGRFGSKLAKRWMDELKATDVWNPNLWSSQPCEDCHPHIHTLLVLPESYEPGSSSWVDHSRWVRWWARAMNLDYWPVVDIRFIYSKEGQGMNNALFEVTKYAIKPLDMFDSFAPFLFRQMHGLKLDSVGGILRSYISDEVLQQIDNRMTSGDEYQQSGVPLEYKWSDEDEQYWISRIAGQTL